MQPYEIWRCVPNWEDRYEVSSVGRVRSLRREGASYGRTGVIHNGWTTATGHRKVALRRPGIQSGYFVHRLVLEAFVGPCPEGMECCHNNGDPADNRVENLRWDSRTENILDSVRHGTHVGVSKTDCVRGHRLSDPNLVASAKRIGHRQCLACARARASLQKRPGDLRQRADEKYSEIVGRHTGDYVLRGLAAGLAETINREVAG